MQLFVKQRSSTNVHLFVSITFVCLSSFEFSCVSCTHNIIAWSLFHFTGFSFLSFRCIILQFKFILMLCIVLSSDSILKNNSDTYSITIKKIKTKQNKQNKQNQHETETKIVQILSLFHNCKWMYSCEKDRFNLINENKVIRKKGTRKSLRRKKQHTNKCNQLLKMHLSVRYDGIQHEWHQIQLCIYIT